MRPLTEKEMKSLAPGKWYKIKGTKVWDPQQKKYVEKTARGVYLPKPTIKPKTIAEFHRTIVDRFPVDSRGKRPVPGGDDSGKTGSMEGRKPTRLVQQARMALSYVYGLGSRLYRFLAGWARTGVARNIVGALRGLFGGA